MQLSRAMIYVKDLRRMTEFYGQALGLQPIAETQSDAWVEFDAGGVRFALHAIPAGIASGIQITSPPRVREESPIKLTFLVGDVDAERARLEALGATIIVRPWGTCDGVDPEGNVFQIATSV